MDVCLSSEQQTGRLQEAPCSPDGCLEPAEGAPQEDGTGGPPGGNLLPHRDTLSVAFLAMAFPS